MTRDACMLPVAITPLQVFSALCRGLQRQAAPAADAAGQAGLRAAARRGGGHDAGRAARAAHRHPRAAAPPPPQRPGLQRPPGNTCIKPLCHHAGVHSTQSWTARGTSALRPVSAAQDLEEVVPSSGSSASNCSSPRGPKGGGTLKTCAVCIEDYRQGCHAPCQSHLHHSVMCLPSAMLGCVLQANQHGYHHGCLPPLCFVVPCKEAHKEPLN